MVLIRQHFIKETIWLPAVMRSNDVCNLINLYLGCKPGNVSVDCIYSRHPFLLLILHDEKFVK